MAGVGTVLSAPWWAWWGKAVDHTPSHMPGPRERMRTVGQGPISLLSSILLSFFPALVGLYSPDHTPKDFLWWGSSQILHCFSRTGLCMWFTGYPVLHVRDGVWAPLHLLTRSGTCMPPRMRVSLYSIPKVPRCQELLSILICNALLTPHSWSPRPLWAFIQISLAPSALGLQECNYPAPFPTLASTPPKHTHLIHFLSDSILEGWHRKINYFPFIHCYFPELSIA